MEHRWYAIQTTSGHENKVRNLLQRKIDGDPRTPEDRTIRQALVPTQEVVEIKNGKKVNVERKIPLCVLPVSIDGVLGVLLSRECRP